MNKVVQSSLPMPLVLTALVPPLPHSSQGLDSDLYYDPSFYTLYTILTLGLLGGVPVLVLTSTFLDTSFIFARVFAEFPTLDHVSVFHATSSLSLMLQPGLRSFAVIEPSSNVASVTPQTTCSAVHLTTSCLPHGLYFSISNIDPTKFH